MTITLEAAGHTHIGQVRAANQDSLLISEAEQLYIVADGMGGHAGGEIASQLCVDEIHTHLQKNSKPGGEESGTAIQAHLVAAINHASSRIYERALEEPMLKGMGTTATVLKVDGDRAYFGHVGDSRLYLVRCGYLYQLTFDHSLVSEQIRAGLLTQEEADKHHLRNVITRSVGYQEDEDVDTASIALEDGDLFLLCSDGLHGKMKDEEISNTVQRHQIDAVNPMIDLANERGGEDNITVIIVKIKVL